MNKWQCPTHNIKQLEFSGVASICFSNHFFQHLKLPFAAKHMLFLPTLKPITKNTKELALSHPRKKINLRLEIKKVFLFLDINCLNKFKIDDIWQ